MEYRKLTELHKLENNPRTIKDVSFKSLCKSIQDNPDYFEARPVILSDRTGQLVIIAGNQRYDAAKHLKLSTIPTHLLTGLTEEREQEIIIRDNVANGEWDMNLLADWDRVKLDEWGVVCDWPVEQPEAKDDDFEIPETIETDIVLGDLFEIGEHRLLCGDSTDSDQVAKLMNGEKADMVFTDPPYGVSYEGGHNKKKRTGIENDTLHGCDLTNLFYDSLLNADIFTHDHAAFYIWYASGKSVETFASFEKLNLELRAVIQWYKVHSGLGAFMSQYIPNCEPCMYAFKIGKTPQWFGPSDEKTVWELQRNGVSEFHPTQKPVELPARAITNSSIIGQVILDLFGGGGSTMVASYQLKRKCYGMELDPKYCQVIIDRMRKLDPTLVIKRNGEVI